MKNELISDYRVAIILCLILLGLVLRYFLYQPVVQQFGASPRFGTEVYWQDVIHEELSRGLGVEAIGKEVRLDDGTRVDLLFPNQACEIDWANKWAEGIGQAIYYSKKTGKDPLVLLLVKRDGWEKYRDRVEFCGIKCWVYDTRTETWLDKE